ncbi:MAG: TolC family protein [Burkholderiales bacterium]|nr:TolC family protein [Burkholderiales bacterium]
MDASFGRDVPRFSALRSTSTGRDLPDGRPSDYCTSDTAAGTFRCCGPGLPLTFTQEPSAAHDRSFASGNATLDQLVAEALRSNPEIQAARNEREAAQQRIRPAGALDDPMLEAGVLNLPVNTFNFRQDDMTMKMLGLSQRLPFPGKRGLREDVAAKGAESIGFAYQETVNRVARDVRVDYYNLALVIESTGLVEKNKQILEQFLKIAESRYAVGQGNQADVLKAQTQVSRMMDELIRLGRERAVIEAELTRTLGRGADSGEIMTETLHLEETTLQKEALRETALKERPQLLALLSLIGRSEKAIDLARKDYYPDFDLKFTYGQRDRSQDGMYRSDMIVFTVGINLPVWRESKLAPRVAEAIAMRDQALDMYQAQQNEVYSQLRQQVASAQQSLKSARLYETGILPQARLTVESSLAAYKVNRVDFLTLLDNQMTVFNYEIGYATALSNYNKALAEIDLIVGKPGLQ